MESELSGSMEIREADEEKNVLVLDDKFVIRGKIENGEPKVDNDFYTYKEKMYLEDILDLAEWVEQGEELSGYFTRSLEDIDLREKNAESLEEYMSAIIERNNFNELSEEAAMAVAAVKMKYHERMADYFEHKINESKANIGKDSEE